MAKRKNRSGGGGSNQGGGANAGSPADSKRKQYKKKKYEEEDHVDEYEHDEYNNEDFNGDDDIEYVKRDDSDADDDFGRDQNDDDNDSEDSEDGIGEDAETADLRSKIQAVNRKKKRSLTTTGAKTSSGGFQSMGLGHAVFKAIQHKGYKVPTPIQRKTIPIILQGKDVVAMARTGSGKSAAFLIPMIERLKAHSAKVGARGLILSPSRELAIQTLKFAKELAKHTDLRACMLVGGENMEEQFTTLAGNPDIIIATPGRLMHLLVEMDLDLKRVEYVVFDEADRLFEMGFAEQLREILGKLPEVRQTLLFSATLPKMLVDFAKAGLTDPVLVRLDVDTKISRDLQMVFFSVKPEEKDAALLYLLRNSILAPPALPASKDTDQKKHNKLTIIFVATKHHVDYLHHLLLESNIDNTYIYGSLDQTARKIHLNRFRSGSVPVLIVTDVAARGIDIPLLDNVINYDFPAQAKVFVHRVGRTARAGRTGRAFSLISPDEVSYLLDLQLFTARPLILASTYEKQREQQQQSSSSSPSTAAIPDYTRDIVFGMIPPSVLDMDLERVTTMVKDNINLQTYQNSAKNGYKLYFKTRPSASKESHARAKKLMSTYLGIHPFLDGLVDKSEQERANFLLSLSRFRPSETVFEVGKRGTKTRESVLMSKRRGQLTATIEAAKAQRGETEMGIIAKQIESLASSSASRLADDEEADAEDLGSAFEIVDGAGKSAGDSKAGKKRKRDDESTSEGFKDSEYYMSHFQRDAHTERGYAINTAGGSSSGATAPAASFAENANRVMLELTGDDTETLYKAKKRTMWDSKKHRFVSVTVGSDNKKRIRTESGTLIPASFKSDRFADWQKRTKIQLPRTGELELPNASNFSSTATLRRGRGGKILHTKVTAADPNSKNAQRKKAKMEAMERKMGKEQGQQSASSSGGADDGMVKIQRGKKQKVKMVKHKTVGAGPRVKSELKNAVEIAKARKLKDMRRAKTGRHKKK